MMYVHTHNAHSLFLSPRSGVAWRCPAAPGDREMHFCFWTRRGICACAQPAWPRYPARNGLRRRTQTTVCAGGRASAHRDLLLTAGQLISTLTSIVIVPAGPAQMACCPITLPRLDRRQGQVGRLPIVAHSPLWTDPPVIARMQVTLAPTTHHRHQARHTATAGTQLATRIS